MTPRSVAVELSVVLPMYNEEACAEIVIRSMLKTLSGAGVEFEILPVDNGSRDGTGKILDRLAQKDTRVRPLHLRDNVGYGGGILAGWEKARGKVLGFTCGDGEVSSDSLILFYRILNAGRLGLIKGKRIDRRDGAVRKLYSFGYHFLIGILFKLHTTDINGYPVLMTRETYERIAPSEQGWLVNVDILRGSRREEIMTGEIDVAHLERAAGRSHVRAYLPLVFLSQALSFWWRKG